MERWTEACVLFFLQHARKPVAALEASTPCPAAADAPHAAGAGPSYCAAHPVITGAASRV